MDNLIILAGLLAAVRSYWVFNLLRIEKGEEKILFKDFLFSKNKFSYYFLIKPFYRKMKEESLKKKVNIITYLTYGSLLIGIYFILR